MGHIVTSEWMKIRSYLSLFDKEDLVETYINSMSENTALELLNHINDIEIGE